MLQAFTGPKFIYLSNNSIAEIPAGAFANLVKIEDLRLLGNEISSIGANAFANLPKLETLYMGGNQISSIEAGLFTDLPALNELSLHTNSISSIGANGFANLPKLETFFLQENDISSIEAGAFTNTPKLRLLNLRDNNLESLPLNLFANHGAPEKLTDLRLSGNPFTTEGNSAYLENGWEITDAAWQNTGNDFEYRLSIGHALPEVLTIDIDLTGTTVYGGVSSVTIQAGSTTSSVITVMPIDDPATITFEPVVSQFAAWNGHINTTSVTFTLPEDLFPNGICDIDANFEAALLAELGNPPCAEVKAYDLGSIMGQDNYTDFADKGIATLNATVTQALTGTIILGLANNDIAQIPAEAFANLTGMDWLILAENEITSVGEDAFANMTGLKTLGLHRNSLTSFPTNVFNDLTSLKELSLDANQIESIEVGAFSNTPNLELLYLDGNSLETLPMNLFANHGNPSKLAVVRLDDNIIDSNGGNGWEITNVTWQSDGSDLGYQLKIGHAVGGNLNNIGFTVTGGTVGGSATGTVDISKGSTTSGSITVVPELHSQAFSLTSSLKKLVPWDGHIGPATFEYDSIYCGEDESFTAAFTAAIDGVAHCSSMTAENLAGLTGELQANGTGITTISPVITQALTSLNTLRLNDNSISTVPVDAFDSLVLTQIDLSNNSIASLPLNLLQNHMVILRVSQTLI